MIVTPKQFDESYLILKKLGKNRYLVEKDRSGKNDVGDVISGICMASLVQYCVYHGGNVIVHQDEMSFACLEVETGE